MSHLRFSFTPSTDVRFADTSVTEDGHSSQKPPLTRHIGKEIPILDEQGNRIGVGTVTGMSFGRKERGLQSLSVDLDISFDSLGMNLNPLQGLQLSLGDVDGEPDSAEIPQTRTKVTRPHGDVLVLRPHASDRTFAVIDDPGAEYRAAWGVVGVEGDDAYEGYLNVYDLRTSTLVAQASALGQLRQSLFVLAQFHPSSTVVLDRELAHLLTERASPHGVREPDTVAVQVARSGADMKMTRLDREDAKVKADYLVLSPSPQGRLFKVVTRTEGKAAGYADNIEGLATLLRDLRASCDPYDITVVVDREVAEQVIDL